MAERSPKAPSSAEMLAQSESDPRVVFSCEAIEIVQKLEETLLAQPPALGEARRLLHTLKGAASAAGNAAIRDLAHALEACSDAELLASGLSALREQLWTPDEQQQTALPAESPRHSLERWHKVVREAARESGKEVRLLMRANHGGSDERLLLRLYEPLLHLLRNAVAHGIEPVAERLSRGKSALGTVAIETHCDAARGTVWILDDGAGIDVDAVRKQARIASLDDAGLIEVLCQPGFSTRERVDVLSGRGLGLYAVRRAIAALGGTLSLHSVFGAGCIFVIDVPVNPGGS